MSDLSRFFTQTVTVETFQGSNAHGDVFAAPVSVPCFVEDAVKLVRGTSAEEIVSSATVFAALSAADQFTPGSRVGLNGRTAFVIVTNRQDSAGPVRIHHAQVSLT